MIRGMPDVLQVNLVSLPCPPASWSARLASKMAWYSGVSGACCPRLRGLLGSHWVPPILCHWPSKSGYLVSSTARAAPDVMISARASAIEPAESRLRIDDLPATIGGLSVTLSCRIQDWRSSWKGHPEIQYRQSKKNGRCGK